MFIKKFEAASLEQALALVKHELGPNALVLSTEQKTSNWFKKGTVEVTAAYETGSKAKEEEWNNDSLRKLFPHRKQEETVEATHPRKAKPNRYSELSAPAPASSSSQILAHEESFLRMGFSPNSARDLSRNLVFDYPKKDLQSQGFLIKAKRSLILPALKTILPDVFDVKRSWVAVGAPGAGKTSFLVKLAMSLKKLGQATQLVSLDKRKILGRGELAAYARSMKIPFQAEIPRESPKVTFIDCPSIGKEISGELTRIAENRAVVCVIDACARQNEIDRILDRVMPLDPKAIAFTKVDLASGLGIVYDVLRTSKLPLLGMSLSHSFSIPVQFFEPKTLAELILNHREAIA